MCGGADGEEKIVMSCVALEKEWFMFMYPLKVTFGVSAVWQ